MRRVAVRFGLLLVLAAGASGCGSPTPDFYTLAPVPGPAVTGGPHRVELRRSGLPGYLDRDELVRSDSAYRVSVSGRERWAESLGSMLDRVFTQDLAARLPGSTVFSESSPISATPDAVVELNIQRFDDDPDGTVILVAQVATGRSDAARPGAARTWRLRAAPASASTQDYVAAMSRALGELASGVAGDLAGRAQ